ncbi:UNVERIFIED_CONTAM: hypothetical protein HDU68_009349 [Siphonaria sp. JEL0065]|nr:hypothetical protein HDU68_009349 [Siphonaria sp. JEL0065]
MIATITQLNDTFVSLLFEANPSLCYQFGIRRFEDKIFDVSIEAHTKFVARLNELNAQVDHLETENGGNLTKQQQEDVTFLKEAITQALLKEGVPGEVGYNLELSNNHLDGEFARLEAYFESSPLETRQDIENYQKRLSLIPVQCQHMIDNYRRGIKRNVTFNKICVQLIIDIGKGLYGQGKDILSAARDSGLNRAEKALELTGDSDFLVPVLKDNVLPAVQSVVQFLESEYIHYARASDGVADIPGAYERYIYINTETSYSAQEIHNIGLAEVERIQSLLQTAKNACGYIGSVRDFQRDLLDSSKFPHLYMKAEDILPKCEQIIADAKSRMVSIFDRFPLFDCRVKNVPKNLEASEPLGQYSGGSPTELIMSGPYVEGWGLYSEFLGQELGIYTDPFEYFGRLEMEMWRAVRLVVDSGLHSKNWSIDESVEYMMGEIAMTREECLTEVRRYAAIPGQALNYKIGELKIKELRKYSESVLGDAFDVKEFHAVVLGKGALPLRMLELVVKEWVSSKMVVEAVGKDSKNVDDKKVVLDILLPTESFVGRVVVSKQKADWQGKILIVLILSALAYLQAMKL